MEDLEKVTYFAETDHRKKTPFGVKAIDRGKHIYVIGKTGMGKSTLLENMAVQDIQNGNGLCFVDPHGKTAELLLEYVPEDRIDDVIYFAPFDMENPMSFNIMEDVGYDKRHLVANGLMSAFKKIWVDMWSARMEYILNNVILALLEYPDSTLLGVNRMLTDKVYRKKVVDNVTDPSTKSFWVDEFAKYTDRYTMEATPAIQNKVGQFTANPLIRNIIGQPKSSFNFRDAMDQKKIIIINLSKGRIGEGNANLLGSMLITKLYLSAMSRADLSDQELGRVPNFYLFVDEFQSFANESFADILSEARKYKLNLTIAHQYIEQMPEEVRAAVFGNVGTMVTFRVGAYDAAVLEKEFAPKFYADDLVNLGFAQIYLKLMIDGVSSHPFSARTLPPIKPANDPHRTQAIERSRKLYARPREEVAKAIDDWYSDGQGVLGNNNNFEKKDWKDQKKTKNVKVDHNVNSDIRTTRAQQFQKKLEKQGVVRRASPLDREEQLRKRIEKEMQKSLAQKKISEEEQIISAAKKAARNNTERIKRSQERPPRQPEKVQIDKRSAEKVSLDMLKKEVSKEETPKASGNRDSLKSALRQVLEKDITKEQKPTGAVAVNKKTCVSKENKEVKKEIKKEQVSTPKSPEPRFSDTAFRTPRKETPQEIPEDVLKKVLDVKE